MSNDNVFLTNLLTSENALKEDERYKTALREFINFFLNNRSYRALSDMVKSRTNITVYDITSDYRILHEYDDKFINNLRTKENVFYKIPYKILTTGERLCPTVPVQYLGTFHKLKDLHGIIETTLDIFIDGLKVPELKVDIMFTDTYFVLHLPIRYAQFGNGTIIFRPYVYNILLTNSSGALIDKTFDCANILVFGDGKLIKNYGEHANSIWFSKTYAYLDILFIKDLQFAWDINFENKYLELPKRKFPIPLENIFTFTQSGELVTFNLEAITGNVFKSNMSFSNSIDLVYIYSEYDYDNNEYTDNFMKAWELESSDIKKYVDTPYMLPYFVTNFKKFSDKISTDDYIDSHYDQIAEYNAFKTSFAVAYNYELIRDFYKYCKDSFPNSTIEYTYLDLKNLDIQRMIRYNNHAENMGTDGESSWKEFNSSCLLVTVPNPNEYIILVYVDGLRFSGYMYKQHIDGVTYFYLQYTGHIKVDSLITFEIIKTKYNEPRTTHFVSTTNDDNTFYLFLDKKGGLADDILSEFQFLTLQVLNQDGSFSYPNKITDLKIISEFDDHIYVSITTDIALQFNKTYGIINENFYTSISYRSPNNHVGCNIKLGSTISDIVGTYNESSYDISNNIRVWKNGRLVPKAFYYIIKESSTNYDSYVLTSSQLEFGFGERMVIEYIPTPQLEIIYKDTIASSPIRGREGGLFNFSKSMSGAFFIPEDTIVYVNGRQIYEKNNHLEIHSTKTMSLYDIPSNRHMVVKLNVDRNLFACIWKLVLYYDDIINDNSSLISYNKWVYYHIEGGPIYKLEDECIVPSESNYGTKYYTLYQELLKHNIINAGSTIPDYILFRYNDLINEENMLMVDANDTDQIYWMPLDSSITYTGDFANIDNLYYQLFNDLSAAEVIDFNDIPTDLYNKYKDLFDHNVLVINVPTPEGDGTV